MELIREGLSPRRVVRVTRVSGKQAVERADVAAVEEPLEIRIQDRSFAVIMRTPGADRHLAAGFLLAEGVISGSEDIGAVEHCRHPEHPESHNIVNVFLLGAAAKDLAARLSERRNVVTNSACGVCGKVSIESLATRAAPLEATIVLARASVLRLPEELRARQPLFDETGALHAAAVFNQSLDCVAIAEDVGRHNAVDKTIGELLLAGRLPLSGHALVVSGRASYEIVQKAWLAGIEIVCAVSAPSSLAIQLAEEAAITLIGFVRHDGFNVYSRPQRIRL